MNEEILFQHFREALKQFNKSFYELHLAMENLHTELDGETTDVNFYIAERYPFGESFDELWFKVKKWTEQSIETIENEYPPREPQVMVCSHCGSHRVWTDATAEWDTESQRMVLASDFDEAGCEDCDGETNTTMKPFNNENPVINFIVGHNTLVRAFSRDDVQDHFGKKDENGILMYDTIPAIRTEHKDYHLGVVGYIDLTEPAEEKES